MKTADRTPLFSVTVRDCEVQHFRAGGPGGQNQNARSMGVRVIHHPSGARGESRAHRSQRDNMRAAFLRMADTAAFRFWVAERSRELAGQETRQRRIEVELADPSLTKVEVRDATGEWVPEGASA